MRSLELALRLTARRVLAGRVTPDMLLIFMAESSQRGELLAGSSKDHHQKMMSLSRDINQPQELSYLGGTRYKTSLPPEPSQAPSSYKPAKPKVQGGSRILT
jgi:hypothetical protein